LLDLEESPTTPKVTTKGRDTAGRWISHVGDTSNVNVDIVLSKTSYVAAVISVACDETRRARDDDS
jgi:hypothetical protein